MNKKLTDFVQLPTGFQPSVRLPNDYYDERQNHHFVKNFIPTPGTIKVFDDIALSLQTDAKDRAKLFTGTFGTGKSDLLLMIANYVTRPVTSELLQDFFERLANLDPDAAYRIRKAREGRQDYLLVLEQADNATNFRSFILSSLKKTLTLAGLGDVMRKTAYDSALEVIQRWETRFPGHIEKLVQLLDQENDTLPRLKSQLQSANGDSALARFRTLHDTVAGAPFNETDVNQRPSEVFDEITQEVVRRGYAGIFLIVDEFTPLLRHLSRDDYAPDSKAIDGMAELAVRSSRNPFHFYVVSHIPPAAMGGASRDGRIALERFAGRFGPPYALQSDNSEALIQAAITQKVAPDSLFSGAPHQRDQLLDLAQNLWQNRFGGRENVKKWVQDKVLHGCFPLHPLTTYCLPLLNRSLAQNERTMFRYISDPVSGLQAYIEKTEVPPSGAWVPLVSLESLFPYFESTLKEKKPDLAHTYAESRRGLSEIEFLVGLPGRLMRVMVLLDAIEGDPNLSPTPLLLRHALSGEIKSIDAIKAGLDRLGELGLCYPVEAGYYKVHTPGTANPAVIGREIDALASTIEINVVDTLNLDKPLNPVAAQSHNTTYGTSRTMCAYFVSPAELRSAPTLKKLLNKPFPGKEGILAYVVAENLQERTDAINSAVTFSTGFLELIKQERVVIAVPHNPIHLSEIVRRLAATKRLIEQTDARESEKLNILRNKQFDLDGQIKRELDIFSKPAEFDWYYLDKHQSLNKAGDEEKFVSQLMDTLFSKSPRHSIAQHLGPGTPKKAVKDAIDEMLKPDVRVANNTGQKEVVLLRGAKSLGVLRATATEGGYEVLQVTEPHATNSKEVWKAIVLALSGAGMTWSDLVLMLRGKPYGLYDSVIGLFFAAFYRLYQDSLTIRKKTRREDAVTGNTIVQMLEHPDDYTVTYEKTARQHIQFLRRAHWIITGGQESQGDAVRGFTDAVRVWYKNLPSISREAPLADLKILASHESDIALQTADVLRQISKSVETSEIRQLLLERLPSALGMDEDYETWQQDRDIEAAGMELNNAKTLLEDGDKHVNSYLGNTIYELFEGQGTPPPLNDVVAEGVTWWRTHRVDFSKLGTDAQFLARELSQAPNSFNDLVRVRLWNRWSSGKTLKLETINVFLRRLQQAISDIQGVHRDVAAEVNRRQQISQSPSASSDTTTTPAPKTNVESTTKVPKPENAPPTSVEVGPTAIVRPKPDMPTRASTSGTPVSLPSKPSTPKASYSVRVESALSQFRQAWRSLSADEKSELRRLIEQELQQS